MKQSRQAPPGSAHGFEPHGFQTDGGGYVWCAVARTQWGRIPGKAQGQTCWFSYGGREHTTGDFYYIGKRGDKGADPQILRYAQSGRPHSSRPVQHHDDDGGAGALLLGLGVGLLVGAALTADAPRHDRDSMWMQREIEQRERERRREEMMRDREIRMERLADEAEKERMLQEIEHERMAKRGSTPRVCSGACALTACSLLGSRYGQAS